MECVWNLETRIFRRRGWNSGVSPNRKLVYHPDRSVEKTKILMCDGQFENGEPQPLYFLMDHPNKNLQGMFKGMAMILQEQGFGDMSKMLAQCRGFKCKPGETMCCCHQILCNQPDFSEVESLLKTHCWNCRIHDVAFCQSSTVNLILLNNVGVKQKAYTGLTHLPQVKRILKPTPFALWKVFLFQ